MLVQIMMNDPLGKLFGTWAQELNIYSFILRMGMAFLCAAMIGTERAHKRHSAGLRTFILVSIASAAAGMFDISGNLMLPIVSAACIIGVAIISGNSLLFSSKNQIKGLTTAFALWSSCFIGLSLGVGAYTAGLIGFVLLMLCLSVLPDLERYLKDKSNHFEVQLELKNKADLQNFLSTVRQIGMIIDDIEMNPAYLNSGLSVYTVSITITKENLRKYKTHKAIIDALSTLEYISYIGEII